MSQRKVISVLEQNGFVKIRSRRHITFRKQTTGKVLTTWVPHHNEVTAFTLNHITKQTGISIEEFYIPDRKKQKT